jgi:hypothetical protein
MRGVVEYRKERDFIGPEITCLPCLPQAGTGREEKMGSIIMAIWRVIEILRAFPRIWSRLGKGLRVFIGPDALSVDGSAGEANLRMEKKIDILSSTFQRRLGFRDIMKVNRKATSESPSFFLPCRVPLKLSFFYPISALFLL